MNAFIINRERSRETEQSFARLEIRSRQTSMGNRPTIRSFEICYKLNLLFQFFLIDHFGYYLGGGFALSHATEASGLSAWLGEQLSGLSVLPPFAIMLIVCVMTAMITEVASNTATANILLPVLAETVFISNSLVEN